MGGDREFFSNLTDGFAEWKGVHPVIAPGETIVCEAEFHIPETGSYFLELMDFEFLKVSCNGVKALDWMLHDEAMEIPLNLEKGNVSLKVTMYNPLPEEVPGKFRGRLLTEDGEIVGMERIVPLPGNQVIVNQNTEPDLTGYTPGTGAAFKSCGRFGFTKGDGVLDCSMPCFGIISRPYVSGHPQFHKNLIWNFSLLPDGEEPSGNQVTAYQKPDNESIVNDWSGVRWERICRNGKKIAFDYSILTPAILIETDMNYIRVSGLKKIGAWKRISLPLKDGVHIRPVEEICYDCEKDGPLSRNWIMFSAMGEFPDVPVEFVLRTSPRRIIAERKHGVIDGYRLEFDSQVQWAMLLFPCGIKLFQPHEITEAWSRQTVELCNERAQFALARPVACMDYFKADVERADVIQKFSYRFYQDDWKTPSILFAPLPPPITIAADHVPDFHLDKETVRKNFPTKYGFLDGVEGRTWSCYSMPVPDSRRDFSIAPDRAEELRQLVEQDFNEFLHYYSDAKTIINPGNYSFIFQYSFVLFLFHLLSPEKRRKLEDVIRDGLKKVCDPDYQYTGPGGRLCCSWYNRKEPFSGITFNMTYLHVYYIMRFKECSKETVENSPYQMFETDWGNGMALYGAWLGSMFTDSWDLIKENWQVFRHAFDYYLYEMDWACMCTAYGENGVTWSDGTNYGGYLGFLNMAEMTGNQEDLALARYAYAKMFAMRTGLFYSAQHYFCKYFDVDPWYCSKNFHEETDAYRSFTSYPESIVRNHVRGQTIYNMTTEGHYKEAWNAYAKYMTDDLQVLLNLFEHYGPVTPWGAVPEGMPATSYATKCSKAVAGWQEVLTYLMFQIILRRESPESIEAKIEEAVKNHRLSREFIGVVRWCFRRVPAEWAHVYLLTTLYGRDLPKLTAWKDLSIDTVKYPVLRITVKRPGAMLEFRSEKPVRLFLNGKELKQTPAGEEKYQVFPQESGELIFS